MPNTKLLFEGRPVPVNQKGIPIEMAHGDTPILLTSQHLVDETPYISEDDIKAIFNRCSIVEFSEVHEGTETFPITASQLN